VSDIEIDPMHLQWRRSRRCDSGHCVEVAVTDGQVAVRDSKNPDGPVLLFDHKEWQDFILGVKDGDFDSPQ